jgi:predicted DNA-binding protein YlxM (UPF0122 family)
MRSPDSNDPKLLEAMQMYYIDQISLDKVIAKTNVSKVQLEQSVQEIVHSTLTDVSRKKRFFSLAGGVRPLILNTLGVLTVFVSTCFLWHFLGRAPFLNQVPGIDFKVEDAICYEQVSAFGDSFNYVNALFSALALAGVILTIVLQTRELRLQREELQETRNELRGQKLALQVSSRISAVSGIIQGYSAAYSVNPAFHDEEYMKWRSKLERSQDDRERKELAESMERSIRGQLDRWISELREIQESRF